ncbi:MAG TPA: ATP-binding protein, partial [Mariprofundaceae bacterium]|nr:ATP-binding protein [Mariprofundaceae bacterium]
AAEIVRDTQASFGASRATLVRLRPSVLDALGLTAALMELAGKAKRRTGTDCILHIEGRIDRLDDIHAITIYRMVQEALTNAQRHGGADRVEVAVKHVLPRRGRRGQVRIKIDDNGTVRSGEGLSEGMGIIGMRERVHALDGTFRLTHNPHDGVHIEATLPLPDAGKR